MQARGLVMLVTAAIAGALLGLGAPGEEPPGLRATAAGSVQLGNSLDGQAILTASALRPGGAEEGTLTLHNLADRPQRLHLALGDLADTPGPGGGALSGRLDLRIERAGDEVFAGRLAELPDLDLGDLDPGAEVPFRFVVSLPEDGPAVDDAYAGASVEVAWTWRGEVQGEAPEAPAPDPVEPAPEDPVAPAGGSTPEPAVQGPDDAEGPAAVGVPAVRLWLGGRPSQRLGRRLRIAALCRPGCTLRASARVRIGRRWRALGRRSAGSVAGADPRRAAYRLSRRQVRTLRAALRRRGALTVRLTVTASSPGHRPVTKTRTLRLRR